MATTIKVKKSGVTGNVPQPSSLEYGELALNYADGFLFYKNANNTIDKIVSGTGGNAFETINANGSLIVADSNTDILSLSAASGIDITANTLTDTVSIGISNVGISTANVNVGNTLIVGVYDLSTNVFSTTSNSTITVDSFESAKYITVKYIIQMSSDEGIHATELFCMQDGITAFFTEYATLLSGSVLAYFSFKLLGSVASLEAEMQNPSNDIINFKLIRYAIKS